MEEHPPQALSEAERLERLFARLKAAPDAAAAKTIAAQIEARFSRSGSDTADLMMSRVKLAIERRNFEAALDLLDYLTVLAPQWPEVYHRRSMVHFIQQDMEAALRDIRMTLSLEPRHWHALAGLGSILRSSGKPKPAYQAFKAALAIHPHFGQLSETIEKMRPEIEGAPI